MDMGVCSLPWLDGVGAKVPFNNFRVTMSVGDCHSHLIDDGGGLEANPAFPADKLAGVGLYVSDSLSDGYIPYGMGSVTELAETFDALNETLKEATNELWLRMAAWSRDQLLDAGALTYFTTAKELAQVAGVFDVSGWLEIDPRADCFRSLRNDEYVNLELSKPVGKLMLPNKQSSPFTMT